jgi:hypothetical protein
MAGGPLYPFSIAYDSNGELTPGYFIGSTNSRQRWGVNCIASLATDRIIELFFHMPPSALPSGTCKLVWEPMADAVSGTIVINPAWVSVAVGEDFDTATLNAEGNTTTTWSTGDDEEWLQSKITLDADTPVAGEIIYMQITFDDTSSLAVVSNHAFSIIWE